MYLVENNLKKMKQIEDKNKGQSRRKMLTNKKYVAVIFKCLFLFWNYFKYLPF